MAARLNLVLDLVDGARRSLPPGVWLSSSWIWVPRPRPMARIRLLCVPYAGGGPSAYLSWGRYLPGEVELRLVSPPGRDLRDDESAETRADNYIRSVVEATLASPMVPYAIFGHSLGALLAHRIACALSAAERPPLHLFVSAKGPVANTADAAALSAAPDAELVNSIRRRYGGLPASVDSEPVLKALVLLRLREDLRLLSQLGAETHPPLSIPITGLWSPDDSSVSESQLLLWRGCTTGPVQFVAFPGGHFYLATRPEQVVTSILTGLSSGAA